MHDKDLIYIGNAASNPVTKFVGILNQLFAPLLTARVLTRKN
jgi:polysaccharide export outer membrane protein